MEKILNKQQIKVIMALNLVLIVMFAGVLLMFGVKPTDAGAFNPPPPHSLIRAARLSANEDIAWETNIGGSGDEQLVCAFTAYGRIYIFGNTLSRDYDFAGASGIGFCAIISAAGNTKSFTVYPFDIAVVKPTLDGFVACGNDGDTAVLKLIDSDGVVTGGATLNPNIKQKALDIYIEGSSYYLVSSYFDNVIKKTTIFINSFSSGLAHKFEYGINCAFDLQYINILPYKQSLMLCANVISVKENYLALVIFDKLNVPTFKYIKADYGYFCYNIMPFDGGYAALANKNNVPEIITITNDFKKDLTKELHCNSADGASMFFAQGSYFSFTRPSEGNATLQKMTTSLTTVKKISEGDDFIFLHDDSYTPKASYVLGSTAQKLKILALASDGTVLQKQIATAKESGGKIVPLDDGILIIANSNQISADIGGNFGLNDIWLAKIRF